MKETIDLNKVDPLKKQGEISSAERGEQFSPMSPPDANRPPSNVKVDYEDMHPYLKHLVDEHNALKLMLQKFTSVLRELEKDRDPGAGKEKRVNDFFEAFFEDFVLHNQKEETDLFPVLRICFLKIGEHSKTAKPITPTDVLKSEHLESLKVAAEAKASWEVLGKIFDPVSKNILLRHFLQKANTLMQMMDLHIFREDDIVFSLAQRHLSRETLDELWKKTF